MKKYVFVWTSVDRFDNRYTSSVPFECEDIEKFINESIDEIYSSIFGDYVLGVYIDKFSEVENLRHSFYTLEDWFSKKKAKTLKD